MNCLRLILLGSSSSPQTLPLLCSDQQQVLNFHADLQHLYAAAVAHGNGSTKKRKVSEEEADGAPPRGLIKAQSNAVGVLLLLFFMQVSPASASGSGCDLRRNGRGPGAKPEGAGGRRQSPLPWPRPTGTMQRIGLRRRLRCGIPPFHHPSAPLPPPQAPPLTADPERASSKPKKKKVGLFR